MNKKLLIRSGKGASLLATAIFAGLGLSLGLLIFYYWTYNVEPRLRREAEVQAKFLAQSQSNILTAALANEKGVNRKKIEEAMDHILLFSDPESGSQIIEGIALELDYDAVEAEKGALDLKRGNPDCRDCFRVEIPLISDSAFELIGLADFGISAKFFRTMSDDIRNKLVIEAVLGLLLLTIVWLAVLYLIRQLQSEIAERERAEAEIQEYARKLEESNRELNAFAHTASHDLQEPLRKINAYGDLLNEEYGHLVDDEGKKYIESMQRAATRMQSLITALLSYSRITTKGEPFVKVDLNVVMLEAVDDLHVRIKETDGKIECKKLPSIEADPVQMRQLLFNLLGNSLKYRREEVSPVVRVTAEIRKTGNPTVKNECVITVKDNGIGFNNKYREKIFTIFQRLHGRNEYEGTGIGLALCSKIVKRHNGGISAEGKIGEGATFTVTLPLTQSEEG